VTPTRRRVGFALVLALVASVAAGHIGDGRSAVVAKARTVDRTLRCPVQPHAGVRQLQVFGQAGVRDQGDATKWFALANAELYGKGGGGIGVQAGIPVQTTSGPYPRPTVWMPTATCKRISARVPLSPRGLDGGAASQLREHYECVVPSRILVRIRAEFRSPTALLTRRGTQSTLKPVRAGYLAARTEAGKPLAYAEVFESGKARLFVSANCTRG
jgi:hypothetical protein